MIRLLLLALVIFSCKAPSVTSLKDVYDDSWLKEDYPYWDIGVKEFRGKISRTDKEILLKTMAKIRVVVNTPEFAQQVIDFPNCTMYGFPMSELLSYASLPYGEQVGDWDIPYDQFDMNRDRVLDTVKRTSYDLYIEKVAMSDAPGKATYADLAYCYLGVGKDYSVGAKIMLKDVDWSQWDEGDFLQTVIHEQLHTLGYMHSNAGAKIFDNAPDCYETEALDVYNQIMSGKLPLSTKYQEDIKKMEEYYLRKYMSVKSDSSLSDWKTVKPRELPVKK